MTRAYDDVPTRASLCARGEGGLQVERRFVPTFLSPNGNPRFWIIFALKGGLNSFTAVHHAVKKRKKKKKEKQCSNK